MTRLPYRPEHNDEASTPFGVRDMLMPADLLDRTNWEDNPLVEYSQRRASRASRFVLTRLLELILLVFAFGVLDQVRVLRGWEYNKAVAVMTPPRSFIVTYPGPAWSGPVPQPVFNTHRPARPPLIINRLGGVNSHGQFLIGTVGPGMGDALLYFIFPVTIFFSFLLLRYHLLINDQSNHIKNLSYERLSELLLTRLGGDDFFLHHFLLFCSRYRVLIVWAAVMFLCWLGELAREGFTYSSSFYQIVLGTLNMVMLTWIEGVLQYVTEWKNHAGGRWRGWRPFTSMMLSLVLAIGIAAFSLFVTVGCLLATGLALSIVMWIGLILTAYMRGIGVNAGAEKILWSRINPRDPDESGREIKRRTREQSLMNDWSEADDTEDLEVIEK